MEGFPGGAVVKNLPASAGDAGDPSSIPESGGSPGEGNGNQLQYSCLENTMDRGAWQAICMGSQTDRTEHRCLLLRRKRKLGRRWGAILKGGVGVLECLSR